MDTTETLHDLNVAVRLRGEAYGEHAAARAALEEAERLLHAATRAVQFDAGLDPVLSATLNGREAIARVRVEEVRERLREAQRDLQRARQLSAPITSREFEIEHLD
ncbi:hypothetical protein [Rhizobium sp. NZLR1]|uniref:hypothetical protein n=1 Tax=Rhizobium sp. NZLR1 TaxID=2731096 RepID=UPI001A97D91A|nr:hypothetical protein [Rhizobium sp. NZLR1]MBX5202234.1 hypothetical protein [Rhizobium sp. NZLR1]QSZ20852.1 hypothetical protein J3O30_21595 [Rhizobium sp. NZLR1]